MIETPEILSVPARKVARLPLVVPSKDIMTAMGPGIQEVYAVLTSQGIAPAGPWLTHHNRAPGETFDFNICVPVDTDVTPQGRVVPGKVPAGRVARAVYVGGYEGLGNGWGEFMKWIAAQGVVMTDPLWEIYERGPESGPDSSQYRTILHKPLAD